IAAGRASSAPLHPWYGPPRIVDSTAVPARMPPVTIPAAAPTVDKRRHQTPSTSSGQNVEAATAKARLTAVPTAMPPAPNDSPNGTSAAGIEAKRKLRTRPDPARNTSCDSTDAVDTVRPAAVERN